MELNPAVLVVEPAAFAAAVALLRFSPRIRQWRGLVVPLLVGISAVAAGFAGGAPTGSPVVDVLLLAAMGAAGALAGLRCPATLVLAASVLAAAGGIGGSALPLALAATGLALASMLVEEEPVVNGVAGALVVQAALRLTPETRGLSALLAAVILVPLFLSAVRSLDPASRRILLRVGAGASGVVVAGALVGAVAGLSAVGPLRRGLSAATRTLDASTATDLETSAEQLTSARRDFARARRSLEAWWAWPARAVPGVAQHWRVLQAAAVSGQELAEVGRRVLSAPALRDVRVTQGKIPLEQLAAVEPTMVDVAEHVAAARRRLDAARSSWLVPTVRDEVDSHRRRLAGVAESTELASRALPLVPGLLGQDEPRRYFLAIQTPVEARASGGFIGNFGEITADDGRLQLTRFGRQAELTDAPGAEDRVLRAPDDFLARYARFRPERSWANVNLSPDFPTTARVIADLYPQSGGAPIDGVISVDPAGLAALLRLVGPVQVPSWPEPITADNALQILHADQYERYEEADNPDRLGRIDFLGDVAQEAWRRFTSGNLPPVPQILATLGPAVADKHILLASTRPDEQRLFEDMDAAGAMAPVRGDFLGLVTQNAAGNKIDYFLRREIDYRVEVEPSSGQLRASVTVALHNEAPATGLSPTVLGNSLRPPLPSGSNKMFFSLYTPWELTGARLNGLPADLERATELGRRVYSSALVIPPKSTLVVELDLAGQLPEGSRDGYRLDVHHQPTVTPDEVRATLSVAGGWPLNGATEHSKDLTLRSDATLEFPLRRP